MPTEQPDPAAAPDPARPDAAVGDAAPTDDTVAPLPPVHERWWWTGTYRAVLGAAVVGYQGPVFTTGEAQPWNWAVAGIGAVVVVWGLTLVWTAYRARDRAS
jgi:type VI protein secretion system component VasK